MSLSRSRICVVNLVQTFGGARDDSQGLSIREKPTLQYDSQISCRIGQAMQEAGVRVQMGTNGAPLPTYEDHGPILHVLQFANSGMLFLFAFHSHADYM